MNELRPSNPSVDLLYYRVITEMTSRFAGGGVIARGNIFVPQSGSRSLGFDLAPQRGTADAEVSGRRFAVAVEPGQHLRDAFSRLWRGA